MSFTFRVRDAVLPALAKDGVTALLNKWSLGDTLRYSARECSVIAYFATDTSQQPELL